MCQPGRLTCNSEARSGWHIFWKTIIAAQDCPDILQASSPGSSARRHIFQHVTFHRPLDGITHFLPPPASGGMVTEGGVVIHRPDQCEVQRLALNQTVIDPAAVTQPAIVEIETANLVMIL